MSFIKELDTKYQSVQRGYLSHRTFDLEFRRQQLRNLYYAILDNENLIKQALHHDLHRAPAETETLEIHGLLAETVLAIRSLGDWAADEPIDADIRFTGKKLLRKEPYGIVLVIGPWNYPFLCTLGPLISAIAAGNTALVKPTEVAVESAKAITYIIEQALDPEVAQVVNGGVQETTEVLKLKYDKIMFTGSNRVGQIVLQAAAKQPLATPVALELGGKSPAVVFASANLRIAAKRLAWAKFANAGQTCIAPDYCIVEKKVAAQFVKELEKAVSKLYRDLTPTSTDGADFAQIISERMFDRLSSLVEKSNGERWQLGEADRASLFFPPTIVSNVSGNDSLLQEELFGPILPVVAVDSGKEASDLVVGSAHDYPLACYIFSGKNSEIDHVANYVRTGAVMVNDALIQGGSTGIPFGGVGNSGIGRYHGKWGFDEFSHEKPVVYQPNWAELIIASRYPPFKPVRAFLIKLVSRPYGSWLPRHGRVNGVRFWLDQLQLKVARALTSKWVLVLVLLLIFSKHY